jgi:hypothetical protein
MLGVGVCDGSATDVVPVALLGRTVDVGDTDGVSAPSFSSPPQPATRPKDPASANMTRTLMSLRRINYVLSL